jgi:hypothetical protein
VTDAQPGHDPRESVAQWFVLQAIGCHALGSPFYGTLCELMAADARVGGPVFDVLGPHAAETFERVYQLRLMGGIHRIVLEGRAPELARHYPSVGGDGDIHAAWPTIRDLIAAQPPEVRDALTHPVQTNEVFRSTALLGGFLLVARDTGLPLRVLELGSSAGLNLRFDHYRYEQAGAAFGPAGSPVRFVDPWSGAMPPLDVPLEVVERRGCDRDPIDPATDDGRLTLLSYVWPGQDARFATLRAALDVARTVDAPIDRADLVDWLDVQLAEPRAGCATVVFHSIVWQYLTDDVRTAARARIESAGSRATADAPLAWLRLEPSGTGRIGKPELWLTQWPGGDERLLATASFQVGPVDWRG